MTSYLIYALAVKRPETIFLIIQEPSIIVKMMQTEYNVERKLSVLYMPCSGIREQRNLTKGNLKATEPVVFESLARKLTKNNSEHLIQGF